MSEELDALETMHGIVTHANKVQAKQIVQLESRNALLERVLEAAESIREESLKYNNWYTFVTCEFGERLDDAIRAARGGDE